MVHSDEETHIIVLDHNDEDCALFTKTLDKCALNLIIHTCNNLDAVAERVKQQYPLILFCSLPTFQQLGFTESKEYTFLNNKIDVITYSCSPHTTTERSVSGVLKDHLEREDITPSLLKRVISYSRNEVSNTDQLKEARERFSLLAKATNHIAWDWELSKGSALWIGKGITTYLKFPKPVMRVDASFWEQHLHPEDKDRVMKKLDHILKGAIISNWEDSYRLKNCDGEYRYIYDRGYIIYKDQQPVRMVGLMEDITAKIELEEILETEKIIKQKQITEAVVTAQEKERSEIGRELHDNVNQLLGASRLYIDAAKADAGNSHLLLSQASNFIKTAIDEIRVLSKVLHTPLIVEIGLLESIENLVEEIMTVNSLVIKINAEAFDESTLNYNFKLTIYRIIQEQLTNILKHAEAEMVTITVIKSNSSFSLSIIDNGIGFDTKLKRKGVGISNIASRTKMYSGKMGIDSAPGKGTVLWVQFPVLELIEEMEPENGFPAFVNNKK